MSVELGFAIVATTDIVLRYGKELKRFSAALRNADTELEEQVIRLDNCWLRCLTQLNFSKKLEHLMDESHLALHKETLHVLVGKLEIATSKLRRLFNVEAVSGLNDGASDIILVRKKLKYAFMKESLAEAASAIESWQRMADPSWFLLLRIADRQLDDELASGSSTTAAYIPSTIAIRAAYQETPSINNAFKGLTLPAEYLERLIITGIRFSSAKKAQNITGKETSFYILDSIAASDSANYHLVKKNVRDLARRLQHTEPQTFGLLSCKGFATKRVGASVGVRTTFTMVLRVPTGVTECRSLRDLLVSTKCPTSLSHRFEIARQLANSVCYVHTFGFVHKNIRPETILGISAPDSMSPSIFLIGFEKFRMEEGRTQRLGDDSFEKNLYRHASRQGLSPISDYIMQHDIYSLGVCLLEIGLWQSFVNYDSDDQNPVPSSALGVPASSTKEEIQKYLLTSAKDNLITIARSLLLERIGTKYTEVVETCLTCLDPHNTDFGDSTEFEDEDGIRVGVRYIRKILHRLNSLNV